MKKNIKIENLNHSTMSEFEVMSHWNTNAPLTLHILVTGMIGNGTIIYIKVIKKHLNETDIYILALAIVDLLVCLISCPQTTFFGDYILLSDN